MTVFSLRMASSGNAVSKKHGEDGATDVGGGMAG